MPGFGTQSPVFLLDAAMVQTILIERMLEARN